MSHYLAFVLFATLVAIAPGPDSFLTLRTTVVGGRARGLWTAAGICLAGTVQGLLAATGLGAAIAAAEPVFQVIRWGGVVYLGYLGISALRAAARVGSEGWATSASGAWTPLRAMRQGFLCNITNPKVLAFNLAVLPQFAGDDASLGALIAYGLTLTAVGAVVLLAIVAAGGAAQRLIQRDRVRRGVEGATGVVFLGFAGALAAEA
jgi:threonine/homoserine/homoserine lactone efflux protein